MHFTGRESLAVLHNSHKNARGSERHQQAQPAERRHPMSPPCFAPLPGELANTKTSLEHQKAVTADRQSPRRIAHTHTHMAQASNTGVQTRSLRLARACAVVVYMRRGDNRPRLPSVGMVIKGALGRGGKEQREATPPPPRLPGYLRKGHLASAAVLVRQKRAKEGGSWTGTRQSGAVGGTSRRLKREEYSASRWCMACCAFIANGEPHAPTPTTSARHPHARDP